MYTYTHRYVKNLRYISQSFLESLEENVVVIMWNKEQLVMGITVNY